MRVHSLSTTFLVMSAGLAFSQVTLDQADAAMSARDAEMSEFQKRLNDPNPDRALAILKLLIVEGDAEQQRLAIQHGLQSTDSAIRAATLRAILDSKPTLTMIFDPVEEEPTVYFARVVNKAGGVINEDGIGSIVRRVTGYDEAEDCWTYDYGASQPCFMRMQGEVVTVDFGDSWGTYRLDNSGQLTGQQAIQKNLTNARIDLFE